MPGTRPGMTRSWQSARQSLSDVQILEISVDRREKWPNPAPSTTRSGTTTWSHEAPDGTCLLYIDRHLVHEVTSPQAFEGLRMAGRKVRAPEKTLAVVDHNVPTTDRCHGIDNPESALQVETLAENAKDFGVEYFNELDHRQGIVHIIGPEQGFTLPGMTIVCGDSHTSTHGAFGALAHGIGTSRGRARARHPDADPEEGEEHAGHASTARCRPASPPRTSSSPSSARSAPPAAPATSSNMPARRSAASPWKAA